jgi:5'-3' exonuclease
MDNDIKYLELIMQKIGGFDKVIIMYDGIYGRRGRGKYYKNYKKNRSGIHALKHKGIDITKKIERCLFDPYEIRPNWKSYMDETKEADDLIAEYIQDNSVDYITIFSTDGDMYQFLKHPHITLHDFSKKITKQDVENKIGLPVEKYVCWKTIVGDPADNLPGMKRFGPQRAKELLSKYESLFEIPVEIFIIYHISDIVSKNTSQQLKDYRAENNLSLKKVKEIYGLWWKKIEDGKKLDLNKLEYEDLCKIVPHNLNCPFEDYNETLSNQYKIIKLPFVQGANKT